MRIIPVLVPAAVLLTACAPGQVNMQQYEPRPVAVPESCEPLLERAATEGLGRLTEAESRMVDFCQHQQLLRAAEEEAAARRLDAHARAAGLALQVTTLVLGATIALIAWAL